MRILYVEDNQANVYLVKRVALGHQVTNYIDGEDALAHIKEDDPDLILMDIQLAGPMSGLDVVRKLRTDGNETPIIAVTAYAMVGDRDRCLAAGCNEYLAKPLPITQLIGLIKKYSELTDQRATQQAKSVEDTKIEQVDDDAVEQQDTASATDNDTDIKVDANVIETPVSEVADEALIFDMETEKANQANEDGDDKPEAQDAESNKIVDADSDDDDKTA